MKNKNWDLDKITSGLEKFMEENGRLPTAREIDKYEHLPTSRTIQREYGGLEKLRDKLGYSITHYWRGNNRSQISISVNIRGKESEGYIEDILVKKFGKMFVHIERPLKKFFKNRLDFYIFSPSGNFGVDVFYPKDLYSMINSINIKVKSYRGYTEKLFFLVANESITQGEIEKIVRNRKNLLSNNINIISLESFQEQIAKYEEYKLVV